MDNHLESGEKLEILGQTVGFQVLLVAHFALIGAVKVDERAIDDQEHVQAGQRVDHERAKVVEQPGRTV